MTLAYPLLPEAIEFRENEIPVLVIENPWEYRKAVIMLRSQLCSEPGDFCLGERHQMIDIAKNVDLVTDPFNLDFDNRKILSGLIRLAAEELSELSDPKMRLLQDINSFFGEVALSLPYTVDYAQIETIDGLIRHMGLKIDRDSMSFPEQLLEYLRLQRDFLGKRLVIFLNLRRSLTEEELKSLYRSVQYEKLNILLLESFIDSAPLDNEHLILVDNDLCVL